MHTSPGSHADAPAAPSIAFAALLALALTTNATAQEVTIPTAEGNPPIGNEPWDICFGETANAAIDSVVDFDTFRFFAAAQDVATILVRSPNGLDPVVQLLDPSGAVFEVSSCAQSCSVSLRTAPLPVTGTYTILISDDGLNEAGPYTLVLERELPRRYVPWINANQTTPVVVDNAVDVDWLHFHAEAGSTMSLAVSSPNGLDPRVEIFAPSEQLIATESCSQSCSLLIPLAALPETGQYTVRFSDEGRDEAGTMQVTLNCIFHPQGICPDPPADGLVGMAYCSTQPNSTGSAATMSAIGRAVLDENRLWLRAGDVPAGQFGLVFFGSGTANQAFPTPNQGTLCVGGSIIRGPILQTCSSGGIEMRFDLASPLGGVTLQQGSTWNFQYWFRDRNPGVTSNTTDALAILFM